MHLEREVTHSAFTDFRIFYTLIKELYIRMEGLVKKVVSDFECSRVVL